MTQIPIYRAKKIDSDEWAEGYLIDAYITNAGYTDEKNISLDGEIGLYVSGCMPINFSTLAIHFPSMVDKNGKKIFASFSKDGVGGDILSNSFRDGIKGTSIVLMLNGQIFLKSKSGTYRPYNDDCGWCSIDSPRYGGIEAIGIYKG